MIAITHGKLDSILTLHHKTWKMILDITWMKLQKKFRGDSGDAYIWSLWLHNESFLGSVFGEDLLYRGWWFSKAIAWSIFSPWRWRVFRAKNILDCNLFRWCHGCYTCKSYPLHLQIKGFLRNSSFVKANL